ncbi:MAG: hypothetical protein ACR2FY_08295 [Pirellulaceae bacterium]
MNLVSHMALVLLLGFCEGSDPAIAIVPGSRFADYQDFEPLIESKSVSPAEAEKQIDAFIKEKEGRADLLGIGEFEGLLNDEYLFSSAGQAHKRGFVLHGYRYNIKTGKIRHLDSSSARKEFGGKFPKGYIPYGELRQYLVKKPRKP